MEYIIHHLDLVEPANQRHFFVEEVQKKKARLEKLLVNYPKTGLLEIFVKKEGDQDYTVTISLNRKGKELIAKESGNKAVLVVNNALDKLRNFIREELRLERGEHLWKRKGRLHAMTGESVPELKNHIKNGDRAAFTDLVQKMMPEIDRYIKKQIARKPALVQLIKKKLLTLSDIADEVYADLFAGLQKDIDTAEKLPLWIFALVDKDLNKMNEKYSKEFRSHISTEQLNKQELKDMQEELTANADFMPELTEELDEDYLYPGEYDLHEILVDAGAEEEILKQAEAGDIGVEKLVQDLPEDQKSVFEWHYLYRIDINEIAAAMNTTENKVKKWLEDAREQLVSSLRKNG